MKNYQIWRGNTWGGACILGSVTPHIPRQRSSRLPNSGVLLYLCLHPLTQNDQIQHGSTCERDMFLEVNHAIAFARMRRAVCLDSWVSRSKILCLMAVAALHQGVPGQMPWLKASAPADLTEISINSINFCATKCKPRFIFYTSVIHVLYFLFGRKLFTLNTFTYWYWCELVKFFVRITF